MGFLAGFSRSGGIVGVRPNARQVASEAAWERTGNKPVGKEINDTPDDPGPAQHPVLAGFELPRTTHCTKPDGDFARGVEIRTMRTALKRPHVCFNPPGVVLLAL